MGKPAAPVREVRFTLPPEVAAQYGDADEEVATHLRELAVVDLVRRGEISSGYGAQVLGLPLSDFMRVLSRHDVSPFDDSEEGLDAERRTLEKLARERS